MVKPLRPTPRQVAAKLAENASLVDRQWVQFQGLLMQVPRADVEFALRSMGETAPPLLADLLRDVMSFLRRHYRMVQNRRAEYSVVDQTNRCLVIWLANEIREGRATLGPEPASAAA